MNRPERSLNANQLKIIAILAMTADHAADLLFPDASGRWFAYALHAAGRLTAPIIFFFLAEGCRHTRDIRKYAGRLFLFALISHFAYCFAFGRHPVPFTTGIWNQTSIIWGLAWAVTAIAAWRSERLPMAAKITVLSLACLFSFFSDWMSVAVLCPFLIYLHHGDFRKQCLDIGLAAVLVAARFIFLTPDIRYAVIQVFMLLSLPLLARYNGKRGEWKGMKWFFYLYYPAHLFLIGLLRMTLS